MLSFGEFFLRKNKLKLYEIGLFTITKSIDPLKFIFLAVERRLKELASMSARGIQSENFPGSKL